MKRIEELGITPTPWSVTHAEEFDHAGIYGGGELIAETCECLGLEAVQNANARLMKSAPRLYKALYGLLFENAGSVNCRICEGHDCEHCPLGEAHKALEEASEGIVS